MKYDTKYIDVVKSHARSLFEAITNEDPNLGYSYMSTISGLEMCGVKTAVGFVWAVKMEDNGSPVGLKIRAGYQVLSLRDENFAHIMLNKNSTSCLCIVLLPSGSMKLTTFKDLLDL